MDMCIHLFRKTVLEMPCSTNHKNITVIKTFHYFPKGTRQRGPRMEVFKSSTVADVFSTEKYLSKPVEHHSQSLVDHPVS